MSAMLPVSAIRRRFLLPLVSMTLLLGAVSLGEASFAAANASADTLAVTSSVDSATPAKTADAGAIVTITVTANSGSNKDGAFNDNVTLTSSDNADKVTYTGNSGTVTNAATTAAASGAATFSVTLSGTAGSHTFTATDAGSGGATSGNEAITDVVVPTKLVVTDAVSGTAADGGSPTLTVKAEDANNNVDTAYTGHVKLTSSVAADTGISAEATAVAGVATFTPTLKGTGTHTFTAKDESSANLANGTDPITVTAGAATKLIVTTSDDTASGSNPAKTAIAGATATVTVTAEDAEGSIATTGYTGTVSLSSNSADAWVKDGATGTLTAPTGSGSSYVDGSYGFLSGDNGVATFTVTINKAGSDEFEATATGLETVSDTLTVKAGAMNKFGVAITTTAPKANGSTCSAASPTAGTSQCWIDGEPIAVKVTAEDAEGNTVTGYTGTMTLAGSDNDAVTYATASATNYTFTTANDGVKTFAVKLQGCEELISTDTEPCSDLLTAADTTTSSEKGTTTALVVPGSVVRLVLAAPSSYKTATGIVSGASTVYTTTPENSYGEPVAPFTDKIHFSSSDEWAQLPSSEPYTYGNGNAAEQDNITLHTPGNETITVKDLTTKTITASTVVIKVTAGNADHLDIFADDNAEDGQTIPVTVAVMDSSDFPVTTGYTNTVTLTSTATNTSYNQTLTHTLTDGVHTFDVPVTGCTSGTCTMTFSAADDANSAHVSQVSFVVHVTPGAVTQFAVIAGGSTAKAPGNATAGTEVTGVSVAAENQYGDIVSDYTGTVHFTSTDPDADLPANFTFNGGPDTSTTCGSSLKITCDNGWGVFNATNEATAPGEITFNTAGTQTITVKAVNRPTIKGTAKVTVIAAA